MIHVATIDVYNFLVGHYGNIEGICKGGGHNTKCIKKGESMLDPIQI